MSDESFGWHDFLGRWQEEWVPRANADAENDEAEDDHERGRSAALLGRPGADESAIAAAEERLGRRLPPSYRAFLAASDGWQVDQTAGVYRLGGAADVDWFGDPFDMTPMYEEELGDDPRQEDVLMAGMWRRALRLETESDITYALLDPGDRDADGEWALYVYKGWSGEFPDRYPSFRAYMEAMYRGFHADRVERADFVNATTRAQDGRVEEARLLALRGRYEEALPLLEEAAAFGRPRSAVLLRQLRQLSARGGFHGYGGYAGYGDLVADPRYLPEILPVEALEPARGEGRPGGDDHWLGMMAARGAAREAAEAVLNGMRDGTYRYAPPGAWGRSVAEAREVARWGATDTAWRVLREGLPSWEAPGPCLIAPVGLLADPVLGPLVTPERGRELLSTPRSGERGPAPEPLPGLDPPGLLWLTGTAGNRWPEGGYRCVWVEGGDPPRLPALIGEEGAVLGPPTDRFGSWRAFGRHGREDVPMWEDRAPVAVGRTAGGWAFAFDGDAPHLNERFVSPAPAASAAGRAVVVWREPRSSSPGGAPAAFHLSVAEGGEEVFAFTVRGTEIERSGAVPDALDPVRLFRAEDTEPENERRVLAALHTELGLTLPRFALTRGRLSTFTTRSWTRAPREGESYACFTFSRVRPGRGGAD
ncbi:SMI1/KNR4 family protein [Streptomyces sp. NPDC002138]|uniref:SMI1/KNR4 family protein n=1 Tax=Streptomyces sp. NPDC002138 TaxID=3154410 RepID=UPI0033221111